MFRGFLEEKKCSRVDSAPGFLADKDIKEYRLSDPEHNNSEPSKVSLMGERRGIKRGIYLLPNLITTGALFGGFYAIIAALSGELELACTAIVIAGFLDALDGRIARLTNTATEFGVQYDSMSDLVAFGVAPSILLYSWSLNELGKLGWIIAFLYVCCTALRLARFNTAPDSKVFFGLPSPMAAGVLATLVWTWVDNFSAIESVSFSSGVGLFVSIAALLMVSNIKYYNPKNIKGQVPFRYMLLVVLMFVSILIYPPGILLFIGLVYGASGPVSAFLRLFNKEAKNLDSD